MKSVHAITGSEFPVLNPYYWSTRNFVKRALWDLNPESWRSRRKVKKLRDVHKGKKAVILCNGPSLLDIDLNALDGVFTFGLNKINLLFGKTSFRPSCIVAVNPYVIEQNMDFYNETELPLFVDQVAIKLGIRKSQNKMFLSSSNIMYFARDCSMSICQGFTVTYVALQLAYHMGFREVALIGCDHDFSGDAKPNELLKQDTRDLSHFDPDYFSTGQHWQYPDLKKSEAFYSLAKQVFECSGGGVYNSSTKTKLDVFPRMSIDRFLGA